jgi:hypothetical protein
MAPIPGIVRCAVFAHDTVTAGFADSRMICDLFAEGIPMRWLIRPYLKMALIGTVVVLAAGCGAASAQSGSAGGSIGDDDKSVSGSRPPPAPEHEAPKPQSRDDRGARRPSHEGGGNGNFDGRWSYVVVGSNCPGTASGAINISGGRVSAPGVSGSVSSGGAYRATAGGAGGLVSTATGRLSGNSGGGSFRRSDGCVGRWTASRQ